MLDERIIVSAIYLKHDKFGVINLEEKKSLWTKNFTIITVGTVISMFGNAIANFAMGLLVLDYSKSTLLYAFYMVASNLPRVVLPTLAGPYIDKFSRRKTIYSLDFLSAFIYLILAVVMINGWFNYGILIFCSLTLGSISSVYDVAYESFYPLLITEGNYTKAYSIQSTLDAICMAMIPASAFFYNLVGIVPLFIFDMITFLIAAIFETRIKVTEKHVMKKDEKFTANVYKKTFKEGMEYLKDEKGLQSIIKYFTVTMCAVGVSNVLLLPYYKANFDNGEYIYILVGAGIFLGRTIGGMVHYKFKYPVNKKFTIALTVYTVLSFLDGSILYFPVGVMVVISLTQGLLGVTSYNIRISATQSYVPDNKKGRFNGMFQMCTTLGMLFGQFVSGILSQFMGERIIITVMQCINLLAVFLFMYNNRKYVKPIYNRQA